MAKKARIVHVNLKEQTHNELYLLGEELGLETLDAAVNELLQNYYFKDKKKVPKTRQHR
jgi:hypothetical protein